MHATAGSPSSLGPCGPSAQEGSSHTPGQPAAAATLSNLCSQVVVRRPPRLACTRRQQWLQCLGRGPSGARPALFCPSRSVGARPQGGWGRQLQRQALPRSCCRACSLLVGRRPRLIPQPPNSSESPMPTVRDASWWRLLLLASVHWSQQFNTIHPACIVGPSCGSAPVANALRLSHAGGCPRRITPSIYAAPARNVVYAHKGLRLPDLHMLCSAGGPCNAQRAAQGTQGNRHWNNMSGCATRLPRGTRAAHNKTRMRRRAWPALQLGATDRPCIQRSPAQGCRLGRL